MKGLISEMLAQRTMSMEANGAAVAVTVQPVSASPVVVRMNPGDFFKLEVNEVAVGATWITSQLVPTATRSSASGTSSSRPVNVSGEDTLTTRPSFPSPEAERSRTYRVSASAVKALASTVFVP